MYGTIGAGPWTVESIVEVLGLSRINSPSPWFVQNGGSVTVDNIFDAAGWEIASGGSVTVNNLMRIQSTTVYPGGSINAANGNDGDGLPLVRVHGPLDLLGSSTDSDGVVDTDRLDVISNGKINLKDGDGDTQLQISESYARFNANTTLNYGNSAGADRALSNKVTYVANLGGLNAEPMKFLGTGSRIQRVTDTDGTMLLEVGIGLDIYTNVTLNPGKQWNTTGVHVTLLADGSGGSTDFEVIAPDNCNVMFVDSNGDLFPPNPCIKYWRSLRTQRTPAELVDLRDNYQDINNQDEQAVYLVEDLFIHGTGSGNALFDLNGMVIYYGGTYDDDELGGYTDGRVTQLLKTTYGDFDGDCDIDDDDQDRFDASVSGVGQASCFPLADADGDCDVDSTDEAIFDANKAGTLHSAACWTGVDQYTSIPPVERDLLLRAVNS